MWKSSGTCGVSAYRGVWSTEEVASMLGVASLWFGLYTMIRS
jgi:hypothetical protein